MSMRDKIFKKTFGDSTDNYKFEINIIFKDNSNLNIKTYDNNKNCSNILFIREGRCTVLMNNSNLEAKAKDICNMDSIKLINIKEIEED